MCWIGNGEMGVIALGDDEEVLVGLVGVSFLVTQAWNLMH